VNKLLSAHPYSRSKIKNGDYDLIAAYFIQSGIEKAKGRRSVQVHIVRSPRQRRKSDSDNYNKVLLDGLVKCGAIIEDNEDGVAMLPYTFERGKEKATIITLEDL